MIDGSRFTCADLWGHLESAGGAKPDISLGRRAIECNSTRDYLLRKENDFLSQLLDTHCVLRWRDLAYERTRLLWQL